MGWRRGALLAAALVALVAAQGALSAPRGRMLVIEGAGDGHGVGMSQVGAEGLALHGWSARQILSHYYMGTSLGRIAGGRHVTVLLQTGVRSIAFSGADRAGTRRIDPGETYMARAASGGRILLASSRGRPLARLAAPLELRGPAPLTLAGTALSGEVDGSYRGTLELREAGRRLAVVNHLGLESYLKGVVPSESPSNWAAAELQAQAIAARSYAITSTPQDGFDVYADTRSQEYRGFKAETPATDAAVSATLGQVVTYAGKPVMTYYFASSGGETENVQDAFPGAAPQPYLQAVLDPYDSTRFGPITMSLRAAQRRLHGIVRGRLESIVVTRRGVSPRVVSAEVVGSSGTTAVTGDQLAAALGLQSTWACFGVTSDAAHLAADWARACARPRTGPGTQPGGGGTVAPGGATGPTGSTAASGPSPARTGGVVAGGATGPPA